MYEAIIFDYGNTLIPFGRHEIATMDRMLAAVLEAMFGSVDVEKVHAVRQRDRLAPYAGTPPTYKENDLEEVTIALVRELYERDPTCDELSHLLRVRFESFIDVARMGEGASHVLKTLARQGFSLGLLSNYPSGRAIRESLKKNDVADLFRAIVVSDDLGFVKPHPAPFKSILSAMQVQPEKVLFVGDNWLADVQGAKRAGMAVAMTTQWGGAPEGFARQPGDAEPDHTIIGIEELLELV